MCIVKKLGRIIVEFIGSFVLAYIFTWILFKMGVPRYIGNIDIADYLFLGMSFMFIFIYLYDELGRAIMEERNKKRREQEEIKWQQEIYKQKIEQERKRLEQARIITPERAKELDKKIEAKISNIILPHNCNSVHTIYEWKQDYKCIAF